VKGAALTMAVMLLAAPAAVSGFELFGVPYEDGQIPVPVSADRDLCPDCPRYYKPYIRAGNTWNQVACSYFAFRERGIRERDALSCDGLDHIEFGRLDLGVLAITSINCTRGGRETGIVFNKRMNWSCKGDARPGTYDLQSVALHEMGHMLGLGHSNKPASVMYPVYNGQQRTLYADDIEGICFLYRRITAPAPGLLPEPFGEGE